MPTTNLKDAVKNAELDLSWVERDPNYIAWRNQVKDYCILLYEGRCANQTKTIAQEQFLNWAALTNAAKNFDGLRSALAKVRINSNSGQHLQMDCLKKRSETDRNLKIRRARKRAREDADSDIEEDDSDEAGSAPEETS